MASLAIEGMQWGDEGKGKITDYFASKAEVVVRSQGGNNAGHSVVPGNKRYALRLLPSGILHPEVTNVIADGVVVNPKALTRRSRASIRPVSRNSSFCLATARRFYFLITSPSTRLAKASWPKTRSARREEASALAMRTALRAML